MYRFGPEGIRKNASDPPPYRTRAYLGPVPWKADPRRGGDQSQAEDRSQASGQYTRRETDPGREIDLTGIGLPPGIGHPPGIGRRR